MILSLGLLLIPFTLVGSWKKHPILALIIAVILAFFLLTIPGLIRVFQVMMIYGTGDPQLMAGGISEAIVRAIMALFLVVPLLLIFQIFMRRRRKDKARYEARLESFE